MIFDLGYPKGLISVEKEIDNSRRIDILCYTLAKEGLTPLILIECKALKLTPQAERQALGYNDGIGAPFIALAGDSEIKTFWRECNSIASVPFLPRYEELVGQLCQN